jgi:hypothetical protein
MSQNENDARERLAEEVRFLSGFKWTRKRSDAALSLAEGYTIEETAEAVGVVDRTIYRWKKHPEFEAEVNRLSLMVDISSRAERLRIAMRVVRKLGYETNRDLLDWLKFAQSETDGVKLDLASIFENALAVARGGQTRVGSEIPGEAGTGTADNG